jgi:hypothetical protein
MLVQSVMMDLVFSKVIHAHKQIKSHEMVSKATELGNVDAMTHYRFDLKKGIQNFNTNLKQ